MNFKVFTFTLYADFGNYYGNQTDSIPQHLIKYFRNIFILTSLLSTLFNRKFFPFRN